jgi:AAA+ ATPase superfamily predicted ATPase
MARRGLQTSVHPRMEMSESALSARQPFVPLREAFTPTRPQRGGAGFVGRQEELRRIMEVIEDEQAHVILYADRGRGKTSLMNRATGILRAAGYCVGRHFCDTNSDYDSIMRGLIRDLPSSFLVVPVSNAPNPQGSEQALPQRAIEPGDLAALPSRLNAHHVVLIIDEFDRVRDETTRDRLADTIK